MKLDPKTIVIGERQRVDLGDIDDLATSLSEIGQINDITVEKQTDGLYHLVTGRRRLAAVLKLGWPEISVKDHGALDPILSQRIELEEDIKRKERTWQEKCIATAKLHKMFQRERAAVGDTWTIRNMESFTGIGKTQVAYMLQLAECFRTEPKDEEMWNQENYTSAVKLLIQRTYDQANTELEKRRAKTLAIAAQPEQQPSLPGAVPEVDTTEPEQAEEKVKIYLRGTPKAFIDCKPDEDFMAGRGTLCIARQGNYVGIELMNIASLLSDTGYAILFCETIAQWQALSDMALDLGFCIMPNPVLWYRLSEQKTCWPFQSSLEFGLVLSKNEPTQPNPNAAHSFVSASPTDNNLAYPVIEHIVSTLTFEAAPVFCFGMISPVDIAMLGRVPIWFEADEVEFAKKVTALKEHYEANVPGCEVVL